MAVASLKEGTVVESLDIKKGSGGSLVATAYARWINRQRHCVLPYTFRSFTLGILRVILQGPEPGTFSLIWRRD